jgi:hypothetical protein
LTGRVKDLKTIAAIYIKMSLIESIQDLKTSPRRQEEYECTSDFLEWFYYGLYRGEAFETYPILKAVTEDVGFECMRELCKNYINYNYTKSLDNANLVSTYEVMKQWTIDTIKKHEEVQ